MMRSIALSILFIAACGGPSHRLPDYPTQNANLQDRVSMQLPSFAGPPIASLESLRGKVVLIDVWATWCAPCKESLPKLQALAEKYKDQQFTVLTINIDDDESALQEFINEVGLELPVWRDPGGREVSSKLRFAKAPTSYLLDRNGVLQATHTGFDSETIANQQREIDKLLEQ